MFGYEVDAIICAALSFVATAKVLSLAPNGVLKYIYTKPFRQGGHTSRGEVAAAVICLVLLPIIAGLHIPGEPYALGFFVGMLAAGYGASGTVSKM